MDDQLASPAVAPIYRHAMITRIWHWLTAVSMIALLGSKPHDSE